MAKIGEFYYNKYAETGAADEGISEFCAAIDGHNKAIAEAKAEIERIKAANITGGLVCSSCGKASTADRKFCAECGGKLDAEKPSGEPDGLVCSSCGAASTPDKKFCAECGGKLISAEPEKRICECGEEIAPGVKFCGGCGKSWAQENSNEVSAQETE
jgi:uncharacterized OB-fold protein